MSARWLHLLGIPRISPRALGVFRLVLGASLFLIVFTHPIGAVPLEQQRVYSPLAGAEWVRALAANAAGTSIVHVLACVSAVAFAVGIFSRAAFVVLVAALFVRTLLILLQAGAHDWGTPIVTLIALLAVPWNDAPGLLAMTRRGAGAAGSRVADVSERRYAYGFAVWLPGLTIGLAFAAAALEKMRRSGLAWVTDGAVRYHFVEDAPNAPFELGMWVATQPSLAILLSLCGILVEALFIGVIFVRQWRARAMFGLAAAGLMAGFWVFQGIHWWAWLMLLAAFLPWNRGDTGRERPAAMDLRPAYAVVVALLVGGQLWATYRRIEIEPLLSHYPMYSSTYDSPEYYERAHARLRFRANGSDITDRIEAAGGDTAIMQALEAPGAVGSSRVDLQACKLEYSIVSPK